MNTFSLRSVYVKTAIFCTILSLVFISSLSVNAQTTTFAQFFERTGGQDFIFNNTGTTGEFKTVDGGSPVYFIFQNITGLPAELSGIQNARLTVTTTTTGTASTAGSTLKQPLNQTTTVAITRDTAATVGSGARTNLLTIVFSNPTNAPEITGTTGGNSATLSATTPTHNVTFTSDFVSFATTTNRNLAFSFSSITPSLTSGTNNILQSFTGVGTGTFASDPPPTYGVTAGDTVIAGRVRTPSGIGVKNAVVTLIEADGTVQTTRTTAAGNFRFSGISAGQAVVISVNSKRYYFRDRVISVQEDVTDLNIFAER